MLVMLNAWCVVGSRSSCTLSLLCRLLRYMAQGTLQPRHGFCHLDFLTSSLSFGLSWNNHHHHHKNPKKQGPDKKLEWYNEVWWHASCCWPLAPCLLLLWSPPSVLPGNYLCQRGKKRSLCDVCKTGGWWLVFLSLWWMHTSEGTSSGVALASLGSMTHCPSPILAQQTIVL